MDLKEFLTSLKASVERESGLVLEGELTESKEGAELPSVKVQDKNQQAWASLVACARPKIVWFHHGGPELMDDWWMVYEDDELIPEDVQELLPYLTTSQRRKLSSLRQDLRFLCKLEEPARLSLMVVVDRIVYEAEYLADWAEKAYGLTEQAHEILEEASSNPSRLAARLAKQKEELAARDKAKKEAEELIFQALLSEPLFEYCTTKTGRKQMAQSIAGQFKDHPGFGDVFYGLDILAERAFAELKVRKMTGKS